MNNRRHIGWVITCVGFVLIPDSADAILNQDGSLDGPCSWASVVAVDSTCTGTLIAPGTVLTSGHCGAEDINSVHFGEHLISPGADVQASSDLQSCERHYLYIDDDDGVDLQVCLVDPMTPAPAVPTIPIMVPTGPARDWLHDKIYGPGGPAEVVIVGAGKNGVTANGDKLEGPAWLDKQHSYDGSKTKLYSIAEIPGGVPFADLQSGDSGGPMFVEMPDGSWMQIGVAHSSTPAANNHEAAPSWLWWIENNAATNDDNIITPCHEYTDGEWIWIGNCQNEFPINPWESYEANWTNDCSGVNYGGGNYPNAGLTPPGPGDDSPGPGGDTGGPWASIESFESAYGSALSLAQGGAFGQDPQKQDLADWFMGEVGADAPYPYLGSIKRAGIEGSYPEAVVTGDFNGNGVSDMLYSDPYYDCGKGQVTVVLDDESATMWTRDTPGVMGAASCHANFGAAVAAADFNDDGYDDVVISTPGETVSSEEQAGELSILYGSNTGLTASGDQLLSQNSSGILDEAESHDFFGEALATGDFNCDGYQDIAVGTPRDDSGVIFDAGLVSVIYGSAGGVSTVNSVILQDGRVNDTPEEEDYFGAALASGNFNGDIDITNSNECFDLAIGVPGEDLGAVPVTNAGFVYIVLGSPLGITTTGDLELHQDLSGADDIAEHDDKFGSMLSANDDGTYWGLTVQVAGESCSTTSNLGQHRFYGSATGITTSYNSLSCENFDDPFNSRDGGSARQLSDYYAIRVLANM